MIVASPTRRRPESLRCRSGACAQPRSLRERALPQLLGEAVNYMRPRTTTLLFSDHQPYETVQSIPHPHQAVAKTPNAMPYLYQETLSSHLLAFPNENRLCSLYSKLAPAKTLSLWGECQLYSDPICEMRLRGFL